MTRSTRRDGLMAGEFQRLIQNLTAAVDTTDAARLQIHRELCFRGVPKVGKFELKQEEALRLLAEPNPSLRPNSDVVRPWMNGLDVTRRPKQLWIIDFNV